MFPITKRSDHLLNLCKYSTLCLISAACSPSAWCQLDVPLAQYDQNRTGGYPGETILTPANVQSQFGLLWSYPVNACVYAHPLYLHSVMIYGQAVARNVIFIFTTNQSVYVYDADSPTLLDRVQGSDTASQNPGDIDVHNCMTNSAAGPMAVMSTPVADRARNLIWYVITNASHQSYLAAYNYSTHSWPTFVLVQAPGFNAASQTQRTGVLYDFGAPYVSFGYSSQQDTGSWRGWLFTYNTSVFPPSQTGALDLSQGAGGNGIWMSGGGIAWDGNFQYFTTGNGTSSGFPNSIVQTPANGAFVSGAYTPPDQNLWNGGADLDLGSSRAIVVPNTPYIISGSKKGDVFIVSSSNPSVLQSRVPNVCAQRDIFGNTNWAFYNGFAEWNREVFTWCSSDYLKRFHFNELLGGINNPVQTGQRQLGYQGANLAVSGNGGWGAANGFNGIVWATWPDGDAGGFGGGWLEAYAAIDPNTLTYLSIYSSHLNGLYFQKFTPPVVANGRVYVATAGSANPSISPPQVLVYGLGGVR